MLGADDLNFMTVGFGSRFALPLIRLSLLVHKWLTSDNLQVFTA